MPLKISVRPFDAEDLSGRMIEADSKNPASQISQWISFDKNDFIIDPNQTEKINLEIKLPENISAGGYYSLISFEPNYSTLILGERKTQVLPSGAVPLLLSVGDCGEEKVSIKKIEVPENERYRFFERMYGFLRIKNLQLVKISKPSINFEIKNEGICHIKVRGIIAFQNNAGRREEFKIPPITVLPGHWRLFEGKRQDNNPFQDKNIFKNKFGEYEIKGSLLTEKKRLYSDRSIIIFPQFALIPVFAVTLLITWLAWKKKRIYNKARKMERNKKPKK